MNFRNLNVASLNNKKICPIYKPNFAFFEVAHHNFKKRKGVMGVGFLPHVPKKHRLVVRYTRSPSIYQQNVHVFHRNYENGLLIGTVSVHRNCIKFHDGPAVSLRETICIDSVPVSLISPAQVVSSRTKPF